MKILDFIHTLKKIMIQSMKNLFYIHFCLKLSLIRSRMEKFICYSVWMGDSIHVYKVKWHESSTICFETDSFRV